MGLLPVDGENLIGSVDSGTSSEGKLTRTVRL